MASQDSSFASSPAPGFVAIPAGESAFNLGKGLTPLSPAAEESKLEYQGLRQLRRAIHRNRVSFPSQVPTFGKHDRPDLQRKLVQLFFVCGWSCNRIAQRYDLFPKRVQQILNAWRIRAVQTGYIQVIPPLDESRMVAGVFPIHVTLFAHPEVRDPMHCVVRSNPVEPSRNSHPPKNPPEKRNPVAVETIQQALDQHRSADHSQAVLLLLPDGNDTTSLLKAALETGARIYTISMDGSLQSLNSGD